ncbi:hypothetical protein KIL84_002321 [Mauremys mutica]|uniref:Uncharacterized protein n=1 Tax=Mauremys mutica TaxID=74926 RepID=A0A9D4AS64_9SAUR|nr:hypothetical protein KIL84_002321 [Mauremys mutica]
MTSFQTKCHLSLLWGFQTLLATPAGWSFTESQPYGLTDKETLVNPVENAGTVYRIHEFPFIKSMTHITPPLPLASAFSVMSAPHMLPVLHYFSTSSRSLPPIPEPQSISALYTM